MTDQKSSKTALVVGLLVGGMLLMTSSTMFTNPQVTFARVFTDSAAGITPLDGLLFIMMEMIGTVVALLAWRKMEYACFDYKCKTCKD